MKKLKAFKMGIEIHVEIFENRAYLKSNYPIILQSFKHALSKKNLKFEERGQWVILTNEGMNEAETYIQMKQDLHKAGFTVQEIKAD